MTPVAVYLSVNLPVYFSKCLSPSCWDKGCIREKRMSPKQMYAVSACPNWVFGYFLIIVPNFFDCFQYVNKNA